jgi:hypothetical protein
LFQGDTWKHGTIKHGLKIVNLVIRIKDDDSIRDGQKDINYYNRAGSQIMEEIRTFVPNLLQLVHTSHTNVITLSANWAREDLRPMVNRILQIREVDGLLRFPNYIEELKDAMEMHDFFKVVAYSSTLLESYGKQILIKHFGVKNQDRLRGRIHDLTFNATTVMLYSNGIIDKPLFEGIDDVRKERNSIIHEMSNPNLITLLSKGRLETMENISSKAIHSVSELMAKLNK